MRSKTSFATHLLLPALRRRFGGAWCGVKCCQYAIVAITNAVSCQFATPPLLEIANVKPATLAHWQHPQRLCAPPPKIKLSANLSITPLIFTLFLRHYPTNSSLIMTTSISFTLEPLSTSIPQSASREFFRPSTYPSTPRDHTRNDYLPPLSKPMDR